MAMVYECLTVTPHIFYLENNSFKTKINEILATFTGISIMGKYARLSLVIFIQHQCNLMPSHTHQHYQTRHGSTLMDAYT